MSSSLRATVLLAVLLSMPAPVAAQSAAGAAEPNASQAAPQATAETARPPQERQDQGVKTLIRDIFGDFAHLPAMSNVPPAVAGTAASLFAHNFDDEVNRHFYGTGSIDAFFKPGQIIGNSAVQIAAATLTYVVGRTTDRPKVTHIAMDLLRAQAVAGALTLVLKETVRRERPDGSGHGSFPSGHASVTFATATVLASHFSWDVAVPMYLVASYTAMSRLHENVHWLSDVVAGGTLGYIVGRTVTRHGRANFAMVPVVQPHGAGLYLSRAW